MHGTMKHVMSWILCLERISRTYYCTPLFRVRRDVNRMLLNYPRQSATGMRVTPIRFPSLPPFSSRSGSSTTDNSKRTPKEVTFFNGQKMPIVGLGTWLSSVEEVAGAVDAALEVGYRHIDTAYSYKNEAAIGHVLKKWFDCGHLEREEIFVTTKLPYTANRAESVEKYLKRSLAALQLDHVDLYLIHHPVGWLERGDSSGNVLQDKNTDHISLWKAMEEQVDAGRACSIGLSNFNARQIKRIVKCARIPPANVQVELHLYFQQKELTAFCKALDIIMCAYSPLGSPGGVKYLKDKGISNERLSNLKSPLSDPAVERIAKKHDKSAAQVLLRHIMQRGIVVIPKSVNRSRIKENFDVFNFELCPEDIQEMNLMDKGKAGRMFDHTIVPAWDCHPETPYYDDY